MSIYQISRTWDGQPIGEKERITLQIQHTKTSIILQINAPFHHDNAPKQPPGSLWELWNYEVVESFFVNVDGCYTELEFGPHGHYLVLRLNGPRSVIDKEHILEYSAEITGDRWKGIAHIPYDILPEHIHRFNFFAIHGAGEARRYLCHSPLPHTHPDFHQPSRFPEYRS